MLTPRQQQALSRSYHIAVTANAGSGKTRVLVERYLDILLSGSAHVGEVVALTYTDKAASELKRKIADAVSAERALIADPARTVRLNEIREQLPAAFIGTIHSFCARLLREYPVEGGVDAAFAIVEGLDQHVLLQQAMKETFHAILRSPGDSRERDALVEAVQVLGKSRTVRTIAHCIEKRERLQKLTGLEGLYSRDDVEILRFWKEGLTLAAAELVTRPQHRAALERVLAASDGKQAEELRATLHRGVTVADNAAQAGHTAELLSRLLRKDGGAYRSVMSETAEAGVKPDLAILHRMRRVLDPLLPAVSGASTDLHRELLTLTRTILSTSFRCLERYEEMKREGCKLDFEDLQLKARALLRREPVREYLARRFKFIMVDEYQDTNELQYDLLLPLLHDLQSGNLFIVGDPKQSIYGFRNANVAIYERTRRDIDAVNRRTGNTGQVVLEESFRPLLDIVAFVNLVFAEVMGPEMRGEHGVVYERLVRARQNEAPGRVEMLVTSNREETSETDGIAERLLQIVGSGMTVFGEEERPRPVRFRDIAVLLRSRLLLPELEHSFARAGVPYVVSGGTGYFQTQEILDFYNYLRFIGNPSDDVALAGILRSPFFTVSDADLFEAAVGGGDGSFWERLRRERRTRGLPQVLGTAVGVLEQDLVVAPRMTVTEILSRIASGRHFIATMASTPHGQQAQANLDKLLQMARAFEIQGFSTLHDFNERLRRLIEEENDEGQGPIADRPEAVQLMTVHAAKGLEFPVVVLPRLERKFLHDHEPFLHEKYGIAFARMDSGGEPEDYPLTSFLRADSVQKTIAEEKRIFYVACTRARDMLILSGNPSVSRTSPSWMSWLLGALNAPEVLEPGPWSLSCTTGTLVKGHDGLETRSVDHSLVVHVVDPLIEERHSSKPAEATAQKPIEAAHIEPIAASGQGEIFSATKIRTYHECPGRYYLQYVLGFPSETGLVAHEEGEEELTDREYPAEMRGRVFHRVMEIVDRIEVEGNQLEREIRRLIATEMLPSDPRGKALAADVAGTVRRVVASDFWQRVQHGVETRTEFTVSAVMGENFLSGTMDRVFRDESGLWHVLDFKTDKVTREDLRKKGEGYWAQLEFYALLVQRFFGVPRVQATILFTTLPEEPLHRDFDESHLRESEADIARTVAKIRRGEFPVPQEPCRNCPLKPEGCFRLLPTPEKSPSVR